MILHITEAVPREQKPEPEQKPQPEPEQKPQPEPEPNAPVNRGKKS